MSAGRVMVSPLFPASTTVKASPLTVRLDDAFTTEDREDDDEDEDELPLPDAVPTVEVEPGPRTV